MKARVIEKDSAKKRKLLKRRREPSSTDETNSEEFAFPSAKRTCQRHKKETIDACADIHGGTDQNKAPGLDGLWLTLKLKLSGYFSKSVRLNMSTCFNGTSNKRSSLKLMHDVTVPKLLSYPKFVKFVNSINTGNVKDFSDFRNDLDDDNQISGSYRDLEEMLLELGDMYVSLDKKTSFL